MNHAQNQTRPLPKLRIAVTLVLFLVYISASVLASITYSPLTGVATANQFSDTVSSYVTAKFIRDGGLQQFLFWTFAILTLLIWIKPIVRKFRAPSTIIVALIGLSSCAPYKKLDVVEVQSNETAWAIPLDAMSQSGQVKFNSVDFLNQKKVATKRIMVDKVPRSIGRMYWSIEWLPSVRVIKIDRSLVTRQWTDGTKDRHDDDYGIGVVTGDSVKLRVGLTITASIEEDDASTYLYYHGARSLEQVLDQNVRSFAVSELTKEYSNLSLQEAQTEGDKIYERLFQSAKVAFKAKGVTIQYLGNAEGLTYADPNVQEAINRTYLAEQDAKSAAQEQMAKKIRNQTEIMNAETQANAAKKLLEAKEAATFQNELQVKLLNAQAQMTMAQRWNGGMPTSIIPSNSPMLMNLGNK